MRSDAISRRISHSCWTTDVTSRSYFSIKTILSLIQNWVSALIITEQQCALDGWGLWPLVAGLAVPSLTDEISTRERWEEGEEFNLTYHTGCFFYCSALKMTKCRPLREISRTVIFKKTNKNCSYTAEGTFFRCAIISWIHLGESVINSCFWDFVKSWAYHQGMFRVCSGYVQSRFTVGSG